MLLKAYTIYDNKSLQYHSPWFAVSDGAATRAFQDLVNDSSTMIGRHPGDYSLWHCGTWDDNKGQLYPQVPNLHIVDAAALVIARPTPLFDQAAPDRHPMGVGPANLTEAAAEVVSQLRRK